MKQPHWVSATNEELSALESDHTWEVTELPPKKKPIGCKCLYKTNIIQMRLLTDTRLDWWYMEINIGMAYTMKKHFPL